MARHRSTGDEAAHTPHGGLAKLGFAPGGLLMRDPKLFVDAKFLGALLAQLENELGAERTRRALFEIGLDHGLRDAFDVLDSPFVRSAAEFPPPQAHSTAIAMRLEHRKARSDSAAIAIAGSWPEAHEAGARLVRLGPCEAPSCHLSAGYTSGWLSGTHALDLLAVETRCTAAGAEHCRFEIRELGEFPKAVPDESNSALSHDDCRVSFAEVRARAARGRGALEVPAGEECGPFDPNDDAVHVWGPVMVLPFTNPDEALATLATLRHDPNTRSLRVAVVDLRGQLLDEAFGAAGLEQTLASLESWNVEVVLTGVSPLAEDTIMGIGEGHLVLRKGLPDAIATAFQIAEAQRHTL